MNYGMAIDLTGDCPSQCKNCTFKNGFYAKELGNFRIPKERLFNLLDQLVEKGMTELCLTGGGDPLFYPWIKDALRKVIETGIPFRVSSSFNVKMDEELISLLSNTVSLRFSLWASNPENYAKLHGVGSECFYNVINNGRRAVEAGSSLKLGYVLMPENYSDVYETVKLGFQLGVKAFAITPVTSMRVGTMLLEEERMIVLKQLEQAKKAFPLFYSTDPVEKSQQALAFRCCDCIRRKYEGEMMYSDCDSTGEVYACCGLKYRKEYSFGNFYEIPIEKIYKDRRWKEFFAALKRGRCLYYDGCPLMREKELKGKVTQEDIMKDRGL